MSGAALVRFQATGCAQVVEHFPDPYTLLARRVKRQNG